MVWQVMDSIHHGQVYLHTKGWISRSWKKHYCAVFKNSQHGVQRLEIYPTEMDFAQGRNGRHLLLTDCVSVKLVPGSGTSEIIFVVQLVTHDQQLAFGTTTQDEAKVWLDALSRSAFPQDQPPTTPKLNLVPSPYSQDDVTYDTPWDAQQTRVLLIPTESSQTLGIVEGSYDLSSGPQGIVLKNEKGVVEAWDYSRITWFGYGENVCALEVDGLALFEFKCAKPTDLYDKVRTKIRLRSNYDYKPVYVKQSYYASYTVQNDTVPPTSQQAEKNQIIRRSSSLHSGGGPEGRSPGDPSPPGRFRALLTRKGSSKSRKSPSYHSGDFGGQGVGSFGDSQSPPLANLDEELGEFHEQPMERSFMQEPAPPRNRFSRIFRSRRKTASQQRQATIGEGGDVKDDDWLIYRRPNYAPPVQQTFEQQQNYDSGGYYDKNGYYVYPDNAYLNATNEDQSYASQQQYNQMKWVDPWHSTPVSAIPSDPQPVAPKPVPMPRHGSRDNVLIDELEHKIGYSRKTPPQPPPKPILVNRNPTLNSTPNRPRDSVASEPAAPGDMHNMFVSATRAAGLQMYKPQPTYPAYSAYPVYPAVNNNDYTDNIQASPMPIQLGAAPKNRQKEKGNGETSEEYYEDRKNRLVKNQSSVSTDVW